MAVITAVTSQNTMGECALHAIPAEFVKRQLNDAITDIRPKCIKIGILLFVMCMTV
jgi:hydroxymethylpyrimidine/phosphomethylpyrimidine kinase